MKTRNTPPDLRFRVIQGERMGAKTTSEGPGNLAGDGADAPPVEEVAMGTILPPAERPDNRPRRGNTRERWLREVIRSPLIGDATRVLLMLLADDMDAKGYVSVPRDQLAERLGRSERRVTERLTEAVEAKLLDRVVRGQKHVTAVYRAMLPTVLSGTVHSPLSSQGDGSQHPEKSPERPAETGLSGTPGGPASSKATRTSQPSSGGTGVQLPSELPSEEEVEVHPTTLVGDVEVVDGLDPSVVVSIFRRLTA